MKLPSDGKYILKRAVEDLLPREIVHRTKMGFPTPMRRWFSEQRCAFLIDYLRDPNGLLAKYFDLSRLGDLLARHQAGTEDATDRIWRLLNLQIWGDLFLTGRKVRWFDGVIEKGRPKVAVG